MKETEESEILLNLTSYFPLAFWVDSTTYVSSQVIWLNSQVKLLNINENRKLPPDDLLFKNWPSNFPFKLTCNNPNSSKLNWILLGPISV